MPAPTAQPPPPMRPVGGHSGSSTAMTNAPKIHRTPPIRRTMSMSLIS